MKKKKKPHDDEAITNLFAEDKAPEEPADPPVKAAEPSAPEGDAAGDALPADEEPGTGDEAIEETPAPAEEEADAPAANEEPHATHEDAAGHEDEEPKADEPSEATEGAASTNQRFSDVLLDGAARIESAKRTGDRLPEAVADFCRKALTKADKLVGTASTFLIEGFRGDIARIARAVPEEFLLAAVERGHVDLASALVEHWAASDDRALSGVVDRVIGAPDRFTHPESAAFLASVARATGVMKPVRASEIVSLAASVAGEESRAVCDEARKIVAAGEFLRQNAPESRAFWRHQLGGTGAAWDSPDARSAISKLRACASRGAAIPAAMLEALPPEEREALAPAAEEKSAAPADAEPPYAPEGVSEAEEPGILPVRKEGGDMPDFQNLRPVIRPPSRNPARVVIAVGIAAVLLLIWILWPGTESAPLASSEASIVAPKAASPPAVAATIAPPPAAAPSTPATSAAPSPAAPLPTAAAPAAPLPTAAAPPASTSSPPVMRAPPEMASAPPAPALATATPPARPPAPSAPAADLGAGLPKWRRDRIVEEIRKQPDIERWFRAVKTGTWESSRKLVAGDVSYVPFQSEAHRRLMTLCTLDPPENAELRRALPRMAILAIPVADLVPLWEQIVADEGPDAQEVRVAAGLLADVDQRTTPPNLAARLKKIARRE